MQKRLKLLCINCLSYIAILLIIEILIGYFLQYRYSHKGFQIVEFTKKVKFKLFRETKNKSFLDNPNEKFSKLIKLRESNINDVFPSYLYDRQLHKPNEVYWLTNPINKRILFCKEKSGLIEYNSNRFGLRSTKKYNNESKYKYIFIGDSITEGACIKGESTIPEYFSSIRKKNTLNAGRSHSGPFLQLGMLTELLKYNENIEKIISNDAIVIWILFTGNDLYNLVEEKTTLLSNYLNKGYSQDYFENIASISLSQEIFLNEFIDIVDNYSERSFESHGYGESIRRPWMANRNRDVFEDVMRIFMERVQNAGLKLKIVSISNRDFYENSVSKLTEGFIDDSCKSLKLNCTKIVVPSVKFKLNKNDMVNSHFTENGYEVLAEIISDSL